MEDYFDIKKKFLREKNADLANGLYKDFNKALNRKQFCSSLSGDSKKLDKFKKKMINLLDRINSVGFALYQIKKEEKDWEKFIETAYHPDRLHSRTMASYVIGAEKPTTLEFAFESFLFFADATFEYLSQTIGVIFSDLNVKRISELKNVLKNNYSNEKLAQKILEILEKGKPLWAEIQEKGVRDFFENVEPYVNTYEGRSLRDIVAHYRAIKVSPIQMTVGRKGIDSANTLKAGVWKDRLGEKPRFGDLHGLVYKTEDYVNRLVNWIEALLELTYGAESTSF